MKYEDLCRFKGDVKTAVQNWCTAKIDKLFPNKPNTRMLSKRALGNWMTREDVKLNKWIDGLLLFIADEKGSVDSDAAIDMLLELLKEMEPMTYDLSIVGVTMGKGEILIELPSNPVLDMFVGNLGSVRFTCEDFKEIKGLLK